VFYDFSQLPLVGGLNRILLKNNIDLSEDKMKKLTIAVIALIVLPALCLGKARDEDEFRFYDDVKYDEIKITSVALLPFKNSVGKQTSHEVEDMFETMQLFLQAKGIKVIDATEEARNQKIDIAFDDPDAAKLAAIGKSLGTDAVLNGTIYKFQTSKKGIATVGITGNLVYVPNEDYIYRAKLAREKKINATKKWITGVVRGESKQNRMKALKDCAADLLNPVYEKLKIGKLTEEELEKIGSEKEE